jgi:hypothetical protein
MSIEHMNLATIWLIKICQNEQKQTIKVQHNHENSFSIT